MALPQTLSVNQVGVALYDATGKFLGYEDIRTTSPDELAEALDKQALQTAFNTIDSITNLSDLRTFLKKLVTRMVKKGLLP